MADTDVPRNRTNCATPEGDPRSIQITNRADGWLEMPTGSGRDRRRAARSEVGTVTPNVPGMRMVGNAIEVADGLSQGSFSALRWEIGDLNEQKESLRALCEERGVAILFLDRPADRVTVVCNVRAVPSEGRMGLLVALVEQQRRQDEGGVIA